MKKHLWILVAIFCLVTLIVTNAPRETQPPEEPSRESHETIPTIKHAPTPEQSPKGEPTLNICGFYLGMDQVEVYNHGRNFGIHLEPGGISPHPCHLVSVEGQPLVISYDKEHKLRWVTGPMVEFENGVVLRHQDSLQAVREKLKAPLEEVSEVEADILCESSVQGFRLGPSILMSVLKDETLVFSIGPFDGWKIAREDGWTRQKQLEASEPSAFSPAVSRSP